MLHNSSHIKLIKQIKGKLYISKLKNRQEAITSYLIANDSMEDEIDIS